MKIINMTMKFIDNRKIIENTINFMGISNNKKIKIRGQPIIIYPFIIVCGLTG